MAERIQLSRRRGWRLPPNAVSVARPTKFGNPFRVGESRGDLPPLTAAQAVARYRRWLESRDSQPARGVDRAVILASIHELRGKNLACWCPPGEPCHADVLLAVANPEVRECRHCNGPIRRCTSTCASAPEYPLCKGWRHYGYDSQPVIGHCCEGRMINPAAEPREDGEHA